MRDISLETPYDTEKSLRESDECLHTLYTRTPAMLHSIDGDGRLVEVSDYWLEVFGYERSEVIGRKSVEFLTAESRQFAATVSLPAFMKTGIAKNVPYQFVKKNGEIIDILLSGVIERDAENNFVRSLASLIDITERIQAQEALKKAQDKLEKRVEERTSDLKAANEQLQREITERKRAEQALVDEVQTKYNREEILGTDPAFQQVLKQVGLVATTNASVLLIGETGTGKELVCQAIHHSSPRNTKPLIKLNCAAIPSGLIESELFGHERGAFTSANHQKKGRFELAHGGTIFLDEIGDLPLETQSKLLRLLQEHEFERLGGTQTIHVDVRVIAATHRDLEQMVRNREFRQDLFYRLNVFPIFLPPLRDRQQELRSNSV